MRRSPRAAGRRWWPAVLAAGALLVGAGAPASGLRADEPAAFLAGIEDLPLMPGLAQVPEAGLVFDKPSGRIVEAYAAGAVSPEAVRAFYARTLPQLGWRARAGDVYAREGERLSLVFLGGNGELVVRFTLEPD